MNRERLVHTALEIAATASVAFLLTNAFSKQTRQKIGERDGWTCTQCGRSFADGYMVHACHSNHDKNNPDYDSVYAGDIRCVPHHLQQHQDAVGQADTIGLTETQNHYAIQQLLNTDIRTKNWLNGKGSEKELQQMSLDDLNNALFG